MLPARERAVQVYTPVMPKVMISLPADLLADLDHEAARRGSTRSGLLQEAVRRELLQQDPAAVDEALARVRASLDGAGAFESAELVRAERDR